MTFEVVKWSIFQRRCLKHMEHWNLEPMEHCRREPMEHWHLEPTEHWHLEPMELWRLKHMKHWRLEPLEHWRLKPHSCFFLPSCTRLSLYWAIVHYEKNIKYWCFLFQSPEQLLENNPQFFESFNLVVATDLVERYVFILDWLINVGFFLGGGLISKI